MIALGCILIGGSIALALMAIFLPAEDPFVDGSNWREEAWASTTPDPDA